MPLRLTPRPLAWLASGLLLAGCGASGGRPTPVATDAGPATATPVAAPTATAKADTSAPADELLAAQLTDVRTGEHFNLGGFQGKQVIVEGMATW